MLPWDEGIDGQKVVDGFAGLEKIDEGLNSYASVGEARRSVHDVFVDRHNTGHSVLLF